MIQLPLRFVYPLKPGWQPGARTSERAILGKGHKIHVCKRCKARPKSERQAIEDKDDIFGFLEQSHISEKNVGHLERMAKSDNPQVASLAAIVLDVARIKPYKKRYGLAARGKFPWEFRGQKE
jgi:hypothetical protein